MSEIRFCPWDRPFLPVAAADLVARYATAQTVDLAELLVVLPGARAGRRLLELLLEEASAGHRRLLPPRRILTVGSLPEALYRSDRPLASPSAQRRAWTRALGQVAPSVLELALGPMAEELLRRDSLGLPRLLDSLHRTIGAAGHDFDAVAEECRRGFLFSDSQRWRALGRIQKQMREVLDDAGLVDREEARVRALHRGRTGMDPPGTLVLLSLAEMPLVTRRMVASLQGESLVYVHGSASQAHLFREDGTLRPDSWQEYEVLIQDSDLVVEDGPSEQAEAVLSWVSTALETFDVQEISVGVPDPSLVPYVVRELETHGVVARYAEGNPLSSSPPFKFLEAVAEWLGGNRFPTLADLLRHPDLPAAVKPEWAPERADDHLLAHLPDRLDSEELQRSREGRELEESRAALMNPDLLGSMVGDHPLTEWMLRILELLKTIYGHLAPDPDPEYFRVVLEGASLIREAAEGLHQLPPELDEVCPAHRAIHILLGELKEARIPPGREEAAVELVGWLELQLDDAPAVVLTGVSEPFLPESVSADPFLPNALRSRLGLMDNQARYARDAYRLSTLTSATDTRLLVAGLRDSTGDPLRPCRLLLTGAHGQVARRVLRLTGEGDPRGAPSAEDEGVRIEAAVGGGPEPQTPASGFVLPPEPFIPLPRLPRPLPVTAFRDILSDPYLWALGQVRDVREVDYDPQELDPMGFGTLAHHVLEGFAGGSGSSSTDAEEILRELNQILDDLARNRYGTQPLPTVRLQVEQLRARLARFAVWQAEWRATGWEILSAEARTPQGGVAFDVDGDPVFLSGRIDRVDRHMDTGAWRVFDVKTGEGGAKVSSARGRGGAWNDLQLPLYSWLMNDLRTRDGTPVPPPPPDSPVSLAYLPLSKSEAPMEPDVAPWPPEVLETAYETAREVIRTLRREGGVHFRAAESGRRARGRLAALMGKGLLAGSGDSWDQEEEA